jgi:hypothetical protein
VCTISSAAPSSAAPSGSEPATMRAASMQRTGRRRLPPAKVLWRMARWMLCGSVVAEGNRRSSAASVRAAPEARRVFTSVFIGQLTILRECAGFRLLRSALCANSKPGAEGALVGRGFIPDNQARKNVGLQPRKASLAGFAKHIAGYELRFFRELITKTETRSSRAIAVMPRPRLWSVVWCHVTSIV